MRVFSRFNQSKGWGWPAYDAQPGDGIRRDFASNKPESRRYAAANLRDFDHPEAVRRLGAMLGDSSQQVRIQALHSLASLHVEAHRIGQHRPLIERLVVGKVTDATETPAVRRAAADSLTNIINPENAYAMFRHLTSELDPQYKVNIIDAIARNAEALRDDLQLVRSITLLTSDRNGGVRAWATYCLHRLKAPNALENIVKLMAGRSKAQRKDGIVILGHHLDAMPRIEGKEAHDAIAAAAKALLEHPEPEVRKEAWLALMRQKKRRQNAFRGLEPQLRAEVEKRLSRMRDLRYGPKRDYMTLMSELEAQLHTMLI